MKRILVVLIAIVLTLQRAPGQEAQLEGMTRQLYLTQVAASEAFLHFNKIKTAREYLEATPESERDVGWLFLKASLDRSASTIPKPSGMFTAVRFSPDGRLLAAGGSDGVITLMEFPGLRPVRELKAHTASISTLCFSNHGTKLASGGRDHTVIVWEVTTGTQIAKNEASFSQGIYQVQFTHDDSLLGVVSWERIPTRQPPIVGFAKVLGALDGKERRRIETDAHPAAGIRFARDNNAVIVSTWGECVYAYDIVSGALKWKYDLSDPAEYNAFHSIDISPDGETVAIGSTDHRIHLLGIKDGSLLRRIEPWEGHTKTIKALAYSPDGKRLASAGEDQTILIWNASSYGKESSLVGHIGTVTGLAWSADGSTLVSSAQDSMLKAWDLLHPFERSYEVCDYGPWQTPLTTDRRLFAAPCSDNRLVIYESATGRVHARLGAQSGLAAVFSKDSRYLASASFDGIIRLWDVQANIETRALKGHTARVDGVAFMNSTGHLVSVGDTTLRVWSLKAGKAAQTKPFTGTPFRIVLHPDERHAYIGFGDGEVKVIATDTWEEAGSLRCKAGLQEVAISQDGTRLAIFSGKNIEVWDTKSLQRTHLLEGHEQTGFAIGFSLDGKYLVSGSNDQTFKIWNLDRGICTLTYHGLEDTIYSSQFLTERELLLTSPQGKVWYYRF